MKITKIEDKMGYKWHKFDGEAKWYSSPSFNHFTGHISEKVGKLEKKLCERPFISTAAFGVAVYAHYWTSKWSYVDGWGNMIKGVYNGSSHDFLKGLGYWSANIVPGLICTAYVTLAGHTFFQRASNKVKKITKKLNENPIKEAEPLN
jgi:hypothetical protein